jgi:hypothetical protein
MSWSVCLLEFVFGCLRIWVFGCLGVWVFGCLGVRCERAGDSVARKRTQWAHGGAWDGAMMTRVATVRKSEQTRRLFHAGWSRTYPSLAR